MYYDTKASGLRIQNLRKEAGMTQEQLAERINTSHSMITKIERGAKGASIDLLIELSILFDTTLDYLILGKTNDSSKLKAKLDQMAVTLNEMLAEL